LSALEAALAAASQALNQLGARFALVGGLAVSARAEPRFTRDLDLAVAVRSDREAEGIVRALIVAGWRVLSQVEQESAGRLATARLLPPPARTHEGVVIDLLFASSGIEREVVQAAEALEVFAGLVIPVASRAHLVALKILASDARTRPQDLVDARALLADAAPVEIDAVRSALRKIETEGYHRGKDLLREFAELLGDA
jgi:hypothetical protein